MVYNISINDTIFINTEVFTKYLNGLITNRTIIKIDNAEHKHICFVESVKSNTLNGVSEFI